MLDQLNPHFAAIIPGVTAGRVVPMLGAGVNFSGRPFDLEWKPDCGFLPSGRELSRYLAERFEYPSDDWRDLARLTQYIAVVAGRGTLYDELRQIFDREYAPTAVHQFFASLPVILNDRGYPNRHQLVMTTNYDDLMERAFQQASEPFDVVSYIADGPDRGKFMHRLYQGEIRIIERIKEYKEINLDERSLVLKIHGTVDRYNADRDSYVITLNDYLEYLIRADVKTLLPAHLADKLSKKSHYLFLGYGLRDWNLQVILHRIWGEQKIETKSWAVRIQPDQVEQILWNKRNVDVLNSGIDEYIKALSDRIDATMPTRH